MFATVAFALALAAPVQASQPSFSCNRASTPAEHAICADARLGRLDRHLAERYAVVRRAMTPGMREALTRDQRWFLGARDEWQENGARVGFRDFPDLAERMDGRIAFLDSLQTRPATRLVGDWRNAAGQVKVRDTGKGHLSVEINAANPVNARWLCDVRGTGRMLGNGVTIDGGDGWRIRVSLHQGLLKVEELAPAGQGGMRPYCGANGHLGDAYFRTR
jgi:uncharacterized protein